jgi:hypothetical protein
MCTGFWRLGRRGGLVRDVPVLERPPLRQLVAAEEAKNLGIAGAA